MHPLQTTYGRNGGQCCCNMVLTVGQPRGVVAARQFWNWDFQVCASTLEFGRLRRYCMLFYHFGTYCCLNKSNAHTFIKLRQIPLCFHCCTHLGARLNILFRELLDRKKAQAWLVRLGVYSVGPVCFFHFIFCCFCDLGKTQYFIVCVSEHLFCQKET